MKYKPLFILLFFLFSVVDAKEIYLHCENHDAVAEVGVRKVDLFIETSTLKGSVTLRHVNKCDITSSPNTYTFFCPSLTMFDHEIDRNTLILYQTLKAFNKVVDITPFTCELVESETTI